MTKNSFQYFIGIGLPTKEDDFFAFLKEHFRANGKLSSPAHVTIIPPFFYDNENALLKKIETWAKNQNPFEVEFKEIESFRQSKYGTIFFAPNKEEHFKDIYDSIHKNVPYLPKKRGGEFIPHLTVANRAPLEKMEEIKQQLKDMGIILELKVKGIVIYKRRVNESWSLFKTIPFDRS